jgi:hypothetical protein
MFLVNQVSKCSLITWNPPPKDFHAAKPSASKITAASYLTVFSLVIHIKFTDEALRRINAAASGGYPRQDFGVLEEFLENFWAVSRRNAEIKEYIRRKMAKGKSSLARQIAELEEKTPKGMLCLCLGLRE